MIFVLALIGVCLLLVVAWVGRTTGYHRLYFESSRAIKIYREEQIRIESLMLKFAYDKGGFNREAFSAYIPGVADCARCQEHIETGLCSLIMYNRLEREGNSSNFVLTAEAKKLLEYTETFSVAYTHAILPLNKLYYHHSTCHPRQNVA